MQIDMTSVGLWAPLDLGVSGAAFPALALALILCGCAAGAALGLAVAGRSPRPGELPWITGGGLAGLLLAVCGSAWGLGVPFGLAIPAAWAFLALFLLPSPSFVRARSATGWHQTGLMLFPVTLAATAIARFAKRAALPAHVSLIAVGLVLSAGVVTATAAVPAVGHHALGVILAVWAAVLAALLVPSPRLRVRILIAAPALTLVAAAEAWRHGAVLPSTWAPALGAVLGLTVLFVRRAAWVARSGLGLKANDAAVVRALVLFASGLSVELWRSEGKALRALARPILLAGLLGLGVGLLVLPDPYRWIGVGAIAAWLLVVGSKLPPPAGSRSTAAGADHEAVQKRRWWIFAGLSAAALILAIDITGVMVALPAIGTDLEAGVGSLAWVVGAYLLPYTTLLVTGGRLGDRFGRRRLFWIGLVLLGVASLWAARSESIETLLAARALQGIAAAAVIPCGLPTLAHVFPRELAAAARWWAMVSVVGMVIGFVFGGLLVDHLGWEWIFFLNLPVVAAALAAAWWLIPESSASDCRGFDFGGLAILVSALALLVWGLIEAPSAGWARPVVVASVSVGALLLAAFAWWLVWRGARGKDTLLPLSLFRDRRYWPALATFAAMYFVMLGGAFLLDFHFQQVIGYSATRAGAGIAVVTAGLFAGAGIAHRLEIRLSARTVVSGGLAVIAIGAGVLGFTVNLESGYWAPIGICLVLIGVGIGATLAVGTHSVTAAIAASRAPGVAAASDQTARQLGGLLGVAVWWAVHGSIWTPVDGAAGFVDRMGRTFVSVGVPAALLGVLVGRLLPGRPKPDPAGEPNPDRDDALRIVGEGDGPVLFFEGGFVSEFHEWRRVFDPLVERGYGGRGYRIAWMNTPWTIPWMRVGRRRNVLAAVRARRKRAIDELEGAFPGQPIFPIGYSFGGRALLSASGGPDPRIPGILAIAPFCPVKARGRRSRERWKLVGLGALLWFLGCGFVRTLRWMPGFHRVLPTLGDLLLKVGRRDPQIERLLRIVTSKLTRPGAAAQALSVGPRALRALRRPLRRVPGTRVRIWVAARDALSDAHAWRSWADGKRVHVTVDKGGDHFPNFTAPDPVATWIDEQAMDLVPPGWLLDWRATAIGEAAPLSASAE